MYEQLSRLSDAELARRGLSRATLGWDVSQVLGFQLAGEALSQLLAKKPSYSARAGERPWIADWRTITRIEADLMSALRTLLT
jgi:hypothetical protein